MQKEQADQEMIAVPHGRTHAKGLETENRKPADCRQDSPTYFRRYQRPDECPENEQVHELRQGEYTYLGFRKCI